MTIITRLEFYPNDHNLSMSFIDLVSFLRDAKTALISLVTQTCIEKTQFL